jgi:hypothetical protein
VAVLVFGIVVTVVNALVLAGAAVRALGGPFDNSPFAIVFVGLALLGPVSGTWAWRAGGRRGLSAGEHRRWLGRVLLGWGIPVLLVSLFLLIV